MGIDVKNMTVTEFIIMKDRYDSLKKFFYNKVDVKSQELLAEYRAVRNALYDMGKLVEAAEKEQIKTQTITLLNSITEFTNKSADEYMENALRSIEEDEDYEEDEADDEYD